MTWTRYNNISDKELIQKLKDDIFDESACVEMRTSPVPSAERAPLWSSAWRHCTPSLTMRCDATAFRSAMNPTPQASWCCSGL